MLHIREERPAQPPIGFIRRDVEPVLTGQELIVLSGLWSERAMVRSTVVLRSSTLIAVHVACYPRFGFTELWRYYTFQEETWQRRTWQQLPIVDRRRILEAYERAAPAFAAHPGNIPGQPELERAIKRGPTYLLVSLQEHQLVSLTNQKVSYILGQRLQAAHSWYHSYPDRDILSIKWRLGQIPTWTTEPFLAAVVECEIAGNMQLSQGIVASEQLKLSRILDQFLATPR